MAEFPFSTPYYIEGSVADAPRRIVAADTQSALTLAEVKGLFPKTPPRCPAVRPFLNEPGLAPSNPE